MFNLSLDEGAFNAGFVLVSSSMQIADEKPDKAKVCELAALAWYEMEKCFDALKESGRVTSKRRRPRALTVLSWEKYLFVTSSVKGGGDSSWLNTLPQTESVVALAEALKQSEIDPPENHRNQAHCGEMLALHQWALAHAASTFQGLGNESLLVTVGEEGAGLEKTLTVKRPCYGDIRPGCEKVLIHLGLYFLLSCEEPDISFSTRQINLKEYSQIPIFRV